jgi:hypothetical protein
MDAMTAPEFAHLYDTVESDTCDHGNGLDCTDCETLEENKKYNHIALFPETALQICWELDYRDFFTNCDFMFFDYEN